MTMIGSRFWAIPEGHIPADDIEGEPALISQEAAVILNAGDRDAEIDITVCFVDRDPIGPNRATVPAERTLRLRFNDLKDPEPIARVRITQRS